MRLVMTHLGEASPFELADGTHTLGGAPEDAVFVAPLPPLLLTLRVEGDRLLVEAHRALTIDGAPFPAGLPRLLLPGETLALPGDVTLERPADAARLPGGTASVFRQLLEESEPAAPAGAPCFTCLTGPDTGRVSVLVGERAVLGRAEDVDVRVRDRTVSRHHARLRREPHGWVLEDLGGPNGVYVRGDRLRGPVVLRDGDVVELGLTLLRFSAPDSPRAPDAPPDAGPPPRWRARALALGAVLAAGAALALGAWLR